MTFDAARAECVEHECEQTRKVALMRVYVGMSGRIRRDRLVGQSVRSKEIEVPKIVRMVERRERLVVVHDVRDAVPAQNQEAIPSDVDDQCDRNAWVDSEGRNPKRMDNVRRKHGLSRTKILEDQLHRYRVCR